MKTFKIGGIHLPDNKLTQDKAIITVPAPKQAVVLATQHLGTPSEIIVKKGDKVKIGQVLTQNTAFISSLVHAPISGTVSKIDDVMDCSGYRRPAIFIEQEGDEWMEDIDRSETLIKDITLEKDEIIRQFKEKGIVGLGGATFPTQVKFTIPENKKVELLIINAVECEPYLTCDHRLMLEKGEEIMVGVKIMKKALGVNQAIIAIENNKPDAIENMRSLAAKEQGIVVMALQVKYPQGAEKQLVKSVTGKEIKSGKLPIDVGVVVNNVASCFATYEAIQKNKPIIERVITVTGKSVKNPGNFLARIGTPLSTLIELAGGFPQDTGKVIMGGPMMGKALMSTQTYVAKGTSGLLFMRDRESHRPEPVTCIRCGKCVEACPMGLEPFLVALAIEADNYERAEKECVMDCIECGCCIFSCPSYRPLLDQMRVGKNKVGQIIRNRNTK